ncbi:MAG: SIS domain-containing protein, partial [Dehalococcoidales bacterium]|nr:SIS domain-containing protein [Dehalococcoidales bacterium]
IMMAPNYWSILLHETKGFLEIDIYIGKGVTMSYTRQYLEEVKQIADQLDVNAIDKLVDVITEIRGKNGRLFFLGVGGSAGNATHAVNDFRKIAGIECYAPTDNVSELTARINDDGWEGIFAAWLKTSKLNAKDGIFIFSVGGGNIEKNVSPNLVKAVEFAKATGAKVLGIVGRDGGYTAKVADAVVIIPTVNKETITPHTESYQGVIWHLVVTHPKIKAAETKWESIKK